ncbi:MAG TPA: AI-2E family transporter [Firmicutes bacterium]|nr:AI-2E family transporter [Bacillota bacterium]
MYRRVLYCLAILASLLLLGFFLYKIKGIFPPFIFAIILAYIFNPVVAFLQKHGFSRLGALIALYFALAGLVFITATEIIPIIITELNTFADSLPRYTDQIQDILRAVNRQYSRVGLPQSLRQVLDDAIKGWEEELIGFTGRLVDGFLGAFSYLLKLILAPVLAFYILKDLTLLKGMVVNGIPYRYRGDILSLLAAIDGAIGGFILGHVFISILVGIMSAIGLYLLQIDFALILGLVAGITNIIPYFGPIIGAVPALAIALSKSPRHMFYVIILFTVIQQVESNILAPAIIGERVGLHPLAVIFILLVGGELFGLPGLLLAVPVAAMGKGVAVWFWHRFFIKKPPTPT